MFRLCSDYVQCEVFAILTLRLGLLHVQMSGRAGRRGLDKVGNVIISTFGDQRDLPDLSSLHMMLKGKSTKLQVSACSAPPLFRPPPVPSK